MRSSFVSSRRGGIEAPTPIGSPLYVAGLDRGAIIHRMNEQDISDRKSLQALLNGLKPGDPVTVEFDQPGKSGRVEVHLAASAKLEVVPFEKLGWEVSSEVLALWEGWLSSKALSPLPGLQRYCPKCRRAFPFELAFCSFGGEKLIVTQ